VTVSVHTGIHAHDANLAFIRAKLLHVRHEGRSQSKSKIRKPVKDL
jgi:hypothetical protein